MFRRKRTSENAAPAQVDMPPSAPTTGPGGYQVVELPTYHKGKRRVVVYRSDASGRIIKTFKK
ncbi:MAG: hypothetical protein ACRD1D_14675 [Acidimicrobiales bacterium]